MKLSYALKKKEQINEVESHSSNGYINTLDKKNFNLLEKQNELQKWRLLLHYSQMQQLLIYKNGSENGSLPGQNEQSSWKATSVKILNFFAW